MALILTLVCLFLCTGEVLYVDFLSTASPADGTLSLPFRDIPSALQSSASDLSLNLAPHQDFTNPYIVQTLGSHSSTVFLCQMNCLLLNALLIVARRQLIAFEKCVLTSNISGRNSILMAVFGSLSIVNSEVSYMKVKSIAVFGEFTAISTAFQHNGDSVIVSNSLGWSINITNCLFVNNTSSAGTVFAISSSGLTPGNSALTATNCVFRNNTAAVGGSVALFMESSYISVPAGFNHSETFHNCTFDDNRGYAFLIYQKHFYMNIEESVFRRNDVCVVLLSNGGHMKVQGVVVSDSKRFLVSTAMQGVIELSDSQFMSIYDGPAIACIDRYASGLGFLSLRNVSFSGSQLLLARNIVSTIQLIGISAFVSNLTVSNSTTQVGLAGFYSMGSYLIVGATVKDSYAVAGGAIVVTYTEAVIRDVNISHCTTKNATWISAFSSNITVENLSVRDVFTNYMRLRKTSYTMFSFINSIGNVSKLDLDLPEIPSTPLIVQVSSVLDFHDVMIERLFGSLVIASVDCVLTVVNVVMKSVLLTSSLFDVSVRSQIRVIACRVGYGSVSQQVLRLESSSALFDNIQFSNLSFPSLVSSINSNYSVSNIELSNVSAEILFPIQMKWYVSHSYIKVENVTIRYSVFDIVRLISGTAEFSNVTIANHRAVKYLFNMSNSTLRIEQVSIQSFAGLFLKSQQNSSISMSKSTFEDFSNDESFSLISDSAISIDQSRFHNFSPALFVASYAAFHITNSDIVNGGEPRRNRRTRRSAYLDCTNCYDLTIVGSAFQQLSGGSGGAVSFYVSDLAIPSSVQITRSSFLNCSADKDGGALRLQSVSNISIIQSAFRQNSAIRGGALFLGCDAAMICSSSVTLSSFTRNKASEGGGVKWTGTRPVIVNNTEDSNNAAYGPFEASIPTHLHIANSNEELIQPPGTRLKSPIIVELRDVLGHIVASENSTLVSLRKIATDGSQPVEILGLMAMLTTNGIANFSSMLIRSRPNVTLHMQAEVASFELASSSMNISTSIRFDIVLRNCIPGEVRSDTGCYLCPHESYSLDPSDTECHQCKAGASCPGGALLILNPGLWRNSNTSDNIVKCPEENLCLGGNESSNCKPGQEGRLCTTAQSGYFTFGHFFQFRCLNHWVHWILILISSAVSLYVSLSITVAIVTGSNWRKAVLWKIILHMSQNLLCISSVAVGWKLQLSMIFILNDIMLSLGFATINVQCFLPDFGWVYFRTILASVIPLYCCLISFMLASVLEITRKRLAFLSHFTQSMTVLCFQCYPYIIKCIVSLLSCKSMEDGSYWLLEDMTQQCWTATHLKCIKLLFVPMAVLYLIAAPGLLIYASLRMSAQTHQRFCAFYRLGYVSNRKHWDLSYTLVRVLAMVLLSAATHTDTIAQVLLCFWFCYFALVVQIFRGPYEEQSGNRLEISMQGMMCVLAAASFYFQEKLPIDFYVMEWVGCLATGLLVAYFIVLVIMFFRNRPVGPQSSVNEELVSVPNPPVNSLGGSFEDTEFRLNAKAS